MATTTTTTKTTITEEEKRRRCKIGCRVRTTDRHNTRAAATHRNIDDRDSNAKNTHIYYYRRRRRRLLTYSRYIYIFVRAIS